MIIDRFVSQFLIFDQEVDTNIKAFSVEHRLVLTEETDRNLLDAGAASVLHLSHLAEVNTTLNLEASNTLTFSQDSHPRVLVENVEQFLIMWHSAENSIPPIVQQTLTITQSATYVKAKGMFDALTLTHSALFNITKALSVTHTLNLSQTVSVYKPSKQFVSYPITIADPIEVRFVLGDMDETFKAPIMGNTNDLSFQRVNRRTRGGDLTIYRDPDWPITEVLSLTFSFTLEADADRLMQVIRSTTGRIINYYDHEGHTWLGVIQNPETQKVQVSKNSYQVQLNFEGDLVS